MPANKRMPGCLTKKTDACKNTKNRIITVLLSYYSVLFRIIPCNVFGHLAVAMGKVFAWATWQLQWAKGGEGGMSTPGMQKHTHMLSQGVVVATSHTASIHNLSIPSYVIHALQTWLWLKCIHRIPSRRLYCISTCLY